jgi:hypothetical protein
LRAPSEIQVKARRGGRLLTGSQRVEARETLSEVIHDRRERSIEARPCAAAGAHQLAPQRQVTQGGLETFQLYCWFVLGVLGAVRALVGAVYRVPRKRWYDRSGRGVPSPPRAGEEEPIG